MKMIVVVALALVAAAAAAPVEDKQVNVGIVRSEFQQTPEGGYIRSYEYENGIKGQETGEPKKVLNEKNEETIVVAVRGFYSYLDKDTGKEIAVNYEADENGYRAEGDSIPKSPAAVARR